MDIDNLKMQIKSITDASSIYLVDILTESSGFFASDSKLLYVAKDICQYSYEEIETDYLKLQTHVRISSIKNNQTFCDDYYNILIYKGNLDDSNIVSFIQLCTVHANNSDDLKFREFFYSLITLFQLPTEQAFINSVGLYGELKFMQYVNVRNNIDISTSWHKNGSYSQYDFSNGKSSIEIKTTMSDSSNITIKHQQLFVEHPCTLVVVTCEQCENGETIEDVITAMHSTPTAFKGINFSINLAKELKRVSITDVKEIHFRVREIQFFAVENINPFPTIPDAVSDLSYKLDISELNFLSETDSDSILKTY